MDVWEYFLAKEAEYRNLSLTPDREWSELFAEEEGSVGQRGRVFGALRLDCEADAFLAVSEVVVVSGSWCEREEYGYFFVLDGVEMWGWGSSCMSFGYGIGGPGQVPPGPTSVSPYQRIVGELHAASMCFPAHRVVCCLI